MLQFSLSRNSPHLFCAVRHRSGDVTQQSSVHWPEAARSQTRCSDERSSGGVGDLRSAGGEVDHIFLRVEDICKLNGRSTALW